MSTDLAVRIRNLSKAYVVTGGGLQSPTFRDVVMDRLRHPLRRQKAQTFWAVRDVSFDVRRGEIVGIIGRNGAGKSTLLKVLSRITDPTDGRIELYGRVGSLLEVGTGFHPELTGRENIYLNGSILGMSRAEISAQFEAIVDFAEIHTFLDTPVKRYSSGMYVRLAFAVAAHLNPEILVVDEVLAVGDAEFQRKCLSKMGQVAGGGRTVLFVSHNMAAVKSLCTRCLLLREGELVYNGDVAAGVAAYLDGTPAAVSVREWLESDHPPGNENVTLRHVRVTPPAGESVLTVDTGADIDIAFVNKVRGINLDCTVYVRNADGILLFESGCGLSDENDARVGLYRVRGRLPSHFLNDGRYFLSLVFGRDQRYVLFTVDDVAGFELENTATGRGRNLSPAPGVVRPLITWTSDFGFAAPAATRSGSCP